MNRFRALVRSYITLAMAVVATLAALAPVVTEAFVPLIDGGKDIPTLQTYKCYFDAQIAKQAATAVGKAIASGKTNIEVQFPPVPNLDEVRFGTPLNQKFGKQVVANELKVKDGYRPGSDLSRQLVAFANVHWAKRLAGACRGPLGKPVTVVSAEPVTFSQIQNKGGDIGTLAPLQPSRVAAPTDGPCIAINPGGEETWDRIRQSYCASNKNPLIILNNAYSTTYGLGNKRGYEEAYYLKRISKGWIFRAFPGKWQAYLEKPDGSLELLESYATKPQLNEVATMVRDESFRRFAINNDRWSRGFGERL